MMLNCMGSGRRGWGKRKESIWGKRLIRLSTILTAVFSSTSTIVSIFCLLCLKITPLKYLTHKVLRSYRNWISLPNTASPRPIAQSALWPEQSVRSLLSWTMPIKRNSTQLVVARWGWNQICWSRILLLILQWRSIKQAINPEHEKSRRKTQFLGYRVSRKSRLPAETWLKRWVELKILKTPLKFSAPQIYRSIQNYPWVQASKLANTSTSRKMKPLELSKVVQLIRCQEHWRNSDHVQQQGFKRELEKPKEARQHCFNRKTSML